MELEKIHEHYLKRELLQLQIDYEVDQLDDFKNVGKLGRPFIDKSVKQQQGNDNTEPQQFPILQHVFHEWIETFPFIKGVQEKKFWQDTVQEFVEGFGEKDISTSADRTEQTKRHRLAVKLKKLILLYTAAGIKTVNDESDARVPRVSERGMEVVKVENPTKFINGYEINVAGVRQATVKRFFNFLSNEKQSEYIIQTKAEQMGSENVVTVARKYSDFKQLEKKLRKEFPGKPMPHMPSRNKSNIKLNSINGNISISSIVGGDDSAGEGDDDDDDGIEAEEEEEDGSDDEDDAGDAQESGTGKSRSSSKLSSSNSILRRERQRTTLRGYLQQLVENPQVSRSQTFLEFLFRDQIRTLSKQELQDIHRRREMDKIRLNHQIKFFEIATARARKLESYIAEFRQALMAKNGIETLFQEIKERDSIEKLSPKFQKFVEWAVIEFAATLYHMFVAEDTSPEFYSQIRRIHALLPYTVLKGILRYSNPVAMMKGVTDLFLAQPFGKRSLLQNIFWIILNDDIKGQEKLLMELRESIARADLTRVIDAYAQIDADTKAEVRQKAEVEGVDLVAEIFASSKRVDNGTKEFIASCHAEWKGNTSGTSGAENRKADLYAQLVEYLKLSVRKRDKDKMQEFWSDDVTIKLIKELVTVFYTPLLRVFKMANMHESVGDFERFMSDLIKVVDKAELEAASSDPNQMVESFIALCTRHQSSVYKFIHQIYKKDEDGLFSALMHWISGIVEFLREGNGRKLDLQDGVFEKARREEPNIDTDLVVKEMNSIIQWIQDRREWRDTQADKIAEALGDQKVDWSKAMPTNRDGGGAIDGSDFGLDNDDLEEFQADEFDYMAFDLEPPPRPEIKETVKLRPLFHYELNKVLY